MWKRNNKEADSDIEFNADDSEFAELGCDEEKGRLGSNNDCNGSKSHPPQNAVKPKPKPKAIKQKFGKYLATGLSSAG